MSANDDSTLLSVDSCQWENLNKFVKVMPRAIMHKELIDFIIAYGFEMGMLCLTGWSAPLTSDQTFENHARAELESTTSALEKLFEIDEDSKHNNHVMFNPPTQRRASFFAALRIGVELMFDFTYFRDDADDNFQAFLDKTRDSGVGLVPNRDEE